MENELTWCYINSAFIGSLWPPDTLKTYSGWDGNVIFPVMCHYSGLYRVMPPVCKTTVLISCSIYNLWSPPLSSFPSQTRAMTSSFRDESRSILVDENTLFTFLPRDKWEDRHQSQAAPLVSSARHTDFKQGRKWGPRGNKISLPANRLNKQEVSCQLDFCYRQIWEQR